MTGWPRKSPSATFWSGVDGSSKSGALVPAGSGMHQRRYSAAIRRPGDLGAVGRPRLDVPVLLDLRLREEREDAKVLGSRVVEVMGDADGEDEDVAGLDRLSPVVGEEVAAAREDVLDLLRGVDVLSEPVARRDAEVDGAGVLGLLAAVGEVAARPHRVVRGARAQTDGLEVGDILRLHAHAQSFLVVSGERNRRRQAPPLSDGGSGCPR